MPDSPDKANERWWASFLFGKRFASQGTAHPDIAGDYFTAEHKYRKLEQYSAEFRKAIQQHDINRDLEPKLQPFVCFTFHGSRGHNARRFLMVEVFPKDKNIVELLARLLDRSKQAS